MHDFTSPRPNPFDKRIYREMLDGNPTLVSLKDQTTFENCLCLLLPQGKGMIFYYPFLVSVEGDWDNEISTLTLNFTSEKVTLKGYNLKNLFMQFAVRKPQVIEVVNPRYAKVSMEDSILVTEFSIQKAGLC